MLERGKDEDWRWEEARRDEGGDIERRTRRYLAGGINSAREEAREQGKTREDKGDDEEEVRIGRARNGGKARETREDGGCGRRWIRRWWRFAVEGTGTMVRRREDTRSPYRR